MSSNARNNMPTLKRIAEWWASTDEATARINQIKHEFDIDLSESLGSIDLKVAHCWACGKTLRDGRRSYSTRDLGLHRCHVIPIAHGGSNHPSNIVLMCADCHKDNPDLNDEFSFWWWFSNVESDLAKKIKRLSAVIPQDMKVMTAQTAEELHHLAIDILQKDRPVLVAGRLSMGSMVAVLAKAIRQYKQGERPLKMESY